MVKGLLLSIRQHRMKIVHKEWILSGSNWSIFDEEQGSRQHTVTS